ncbi:shikimate kinase [uncultured Polaribacter sp.]|jgi:shikimate kinase|uniref:shikimate kinase n=1 Tax=uncultured Polaribacter sp. TaxID=174711 RepID=UPI0030D8870B
MKIVLLGYMASGKSTIGREISKKLDMKFIDLDDYISKREKSSISEIFKVKGEIYFRRIESFYLSEILNSKDSIILSLGGGTPCYSNNMELILNSEASSIYIKASIKTLVTRLTSEKNKRPLVAELENDKLTEFVAKHLFERRFFYEQASITVITEDKSIEEITTEIRILLY